jgi:hypothetical protein
LQRGLGDISPALLTGRLKSFEEAGLIVRRRIDGGRGFEYLPTPACEALAPVIVSLGEWGLVWARHRLTQEDFDADFLMHHLELSVDPAQLPGDETVIQFKFADLPEQRDWWLLVEGDCVDICITPPGKDIDVFVTTTVRTMHDVWMGDRSYRDAMNSGDMMIEGELALTRRISTWMRPSIFFAAQRAPVPTSIPAPALAAA